MKHQPPRLARKFLEIVAGSAPIDDLMGDLEERFAYNQRKGSSRKAKLQYWKDVLSLSFSYAIRKRKRDASSGPFASSSSFSFDMLANYTKVALRSVYQHKYFSVLNAFGMAIGMSISLLLIAIYSYVSTYDSFHQNKEDIYTIISHHKEGVDEASYATAPAMLASRLEHEYSGIKEVVRIKRAYDVSAVMEKDNIPLNAYYVDPNFFRVFSFDLIQGSAEELANPNTIALSESAALKLFNSRDVVGKTITLEGEVTVQVSALMKDHPKNSHLTFDVLISRSSLPERRDAALDQWTHFDGEYVYVLVNDKRDRPQLQAYLDNIARDTYRPSDIKISFELEHMMDIAMGRDLRHAIGTKWEASGFLMFAVFALLILLPACFNYTNISIARAIRRAKEIGLRKTMGGGRNQIFLQFIAETVIITLISLGGALFIFVLIRAEFQSMMVGGASLDLSLSVRMILMFVSFALVTGFLAGVVPALYFSGLNPIQALKSKINSHGSSMPIRKVLTVFQFALSFGFILALVVFSRQYRYSVNFDFGFTSENIVNVMLKDVKQDQFRNAFSQLASVSSISMTSGLPGVNSTSTWVEKGSDSVEVSQLFADHYFVSNFGLDFVAGGNFPEQPWKREKHLIVNEEFLKIHSIEDPSAILGKTFKVEGKDLEVIGVLKNFHYQTLNHPVEAFFLRMDPGHFRFANLRVTSDDAFDMFTQMEHAWKTLPTEMNFKASFFEDDLQEAYQTYTVLLKIIGFLGLLAISISLLGMLGMVVYTAETKTREVGVRKVMGATASNIAVLLSKDYLKMMVWAILFAVPLTIWILATMMPHVQHYHAELSPWDVVLSALILIALGVLTILSQTWKTAMTNPAETLRSE